MLYSCIADLKAVSTHIETSTQNLALSPWSDAEMKIAEDRASAKPVAANCKRHCPCCSRCACTTEWRQPAFGHSTFTLGLAWLECSGPSASADPSEPALCTSSEGTGFATRSVPFVEYARAKARGGPGHRCSCICCSLLLWGPGAYLRSRTGRRSRTVLTFASWSHLTI